MYFILLLSKKKEYEYIHTYLLIREKPNQTCLLNDHLQEERE